MGTTYKQKSTEARRKVLEMIWKAKTSHVASNFSAVDIAVVLYNNLKQGDEVVWSAGWKSALIYFMLAQQGKIPKEDLEIFAKEENGVIKYLGLAETTTPGVWVNGGSMGHGLPIAVGMAIGKKRANEPGTIYCIMSDGEMNEGTTWESAMLAQHHKLDNLVVIVDKNKWQAMGETKDILDVNIAEAFRGFGFYVEKINGHHHSTINRTLHLVQLKPGGPVAIICSTKKGKGVSFMENQLLYHYKHVSDEEYEKALKEL